MSETSRPLAISRPRDHVAIWAIVFLVSGQGFRLLLGIPLYAVLAVATIAAIAVAYRPSLRSLRPPVLLGAFIGLAVASTLWSATPWITVLASVILLAITFMALSIVRQTTVGRVMGMVYRGFQASLFIGIVFELIVAVFFRRPIGPRQNDLVGIADGLLSVEFLWSENRLFTGGPIQGFVGNRNSFAAIALFVLVGVVILVLDRRIGRLDAIVSGLLALGVLYLTQSATITIAAVFALGLFVSAMIIRSAPVRFKRALSFTVLGLTAMSAVVTLKYYSVIFTLLGRSPDATDRADIWAAMFTYSLQRPEGWGYVSYWPIFEEPYASIVENSGVFYAAHGHSSYFDAWLQMGIVGAALLVTLVLLTFLGAWRLVERAEPKDSYIPLGWSLMIAILAVQSLAESRLMSEWGWFLLVVLFCSAPGAFSLTLISEDMVRTGDRTPSGGRERSRPWLVRHHY